MHPLCSAGYPHSFQGGALPNVSFSTVPVFRGTNETDACRRGVLFNPPLSTQDGRSVINLKALSLWVLPQHFKMKGIHTLRGIVAQDEWLAKLDLKDVYFTVPVYQEHWKFLPFVVDQVHC